MSEATLPPITLSSDPTPLRMDDGGVIRIGGTRVSLDVVVEQYENGMTPEELVRAYDSLDLADVHQVIAWYLRHRAEVIIYLSRRKQDATELQVRISKERPRLSRTSLISRSIAQKDLNAPAGD